MQLLVKNAAILHPDVGAGSERSDVFIKDGIIAAIGQHLQAPGALVLQEEGLCLSPGWMDIGAFTGDPGYEHREDSRSLARAAAAGGYTALACLPNTLPVADNNSSVEYLRSRSANSLVNFHPIGAVSAGCKGKDLTEIYDMRAAGAVAFSDGLHSIQDSGLMLRALQYVQPFDGVVINQPMDCQVAPGGQMHEGVISTSLGLRGIPALAEVLMIQRDLQLAAYAGARLHLHHLSTAEGVSLVRQAKATGLRVTASVAAMNLACDDHLLSDFDSNFKVMPPVRERADFEALRAGLADGTIDCIGSNHLPLDEEAKHLEFLYADFGTIGLESTFGLCRMHLQDQLSLASLVEKLAVAPRRILGLPLPAIKVGESAELTIFNPETNWTFAAEHIRSKSKNTPFIGWRMKGRVLAVVNNGKLWHL
jgi:dihydroorotase